MTYQVKENISIDDIKNLFETDQNIELSHSARSKVVKCRSFLEEKIQNSSNSIYGLNTGFGSLCKVKISNSELDKLQENLVISHACGTGDTVPQKIVRLMLLLKVQSLSLGHSGIREVTIDRLIDFYNHNTLPVIYEMGSLGASGDLAPLAHLSLPLIGLGEFWGGNVKKKSAELLKDNNWESLTLKAKEGLALLNGTQFMSAYGTYILIQTEKLLYLADLISAISLDAFDCRIEPFDELVHQIRPHKGQLETAKVIRSLLADSSIAKQPKEQVQDPYAFRCIPQVHGASKRVVEKAKEVFEIEINSVTDNPLIFPEEDKIISGGNFHGQHLAIELDYLAIGLAELGNISERRTYQLVSGQRNLPEFLTINPGLNSGLMIPQYTAASLVSQNKQLCTPASVDSITSSNGQEDHVSMGANAATKCYKVLKNIERILAIELLTATQALDIRKNKSKLASSNVLEKTLMDYRKTVPFIEEDRVLHEDIERSVEYISTYNKIV